MLYVADKWLVERMYLQKYLIAIQSIIMMKILLCGSRLILMITLVKQILKILLQFSVRLGF